MITLEEARENIGAPVIYAPHQAARRWERGTITRVSETLVFVLYDGDKHAKGTTPDCLTLDLACNVSGCERPAQPEHSPCCDSRQHGLNLCCTHYCRAHFVEVHRCSPETHQEGLTS